MIACLVLLSLVEGLKVQIEIPDIQTMFTIDSSAKVMSTDFDCQIIEDAIHYEAAFYNRKLGWKTMIEAFLNVFALRYTLNIS